ncbi:Uncharacterized protein SCF082_LOCUS13970 [Durusdinium trenchii]|uniref:Uncharacterized protein n=1 Tax=Durusdinium trenchii TaxID=1381693 RepID=A0ABP0JVC2_9DINO
MAQDPNLGQSPATPFSAAADSAAGWLASPATPAASSVAGLLTGSMEPAETPSAAITQLEHSCEKALQQFCGPQQYLIANLSSHDAVENFSEWLRVTFPEADDCLYSDKPLSKVSGQNPDFACQIPLCLHVSMLGFTSACTLKPPPGSEHCNNLIQEFLKDGFLTASDPLLVMEHDPDCAPFDVPMHPSQKARAFSLAYLKGYARSCTLLFVLHRIKSLGLDLAEDESLKPLMGSVVKIWAHCVHHPSRMDEALQNMKLSARGSLRHANNLIQCCFIIRNLRGKCGLSDSSVFVKRWNSMSTKQFQITGKRATALKFLLDQTPEHVLSLVLDHVNDFGWDKNLWSDDSLAVKKMYPNFQFACAKKSWLPRMKTTEESMELCIKHLQNGFVAKSLYLRRKVDAQTVEETSQRAAVVWHLGQELLSQIPIDPAKIKEVWYDSFAAGDGPVDAEIQGILMDKSENFDLRRDSPTLKKLCDQQSFAKPVCASAIEEATLQVDKFALVMKQLQYDLQVYETWSRKTASVKSAQEHQRHLWMLQRRKRCEAAAQTFLSRSLKLVVWDKRRAEQSIAECMNFKREVCQQQGISPDDMYTLLYWNCSAPCLMPSASYNNATNVVAWALNDQMRSTALILTRTFSYSKGKVFLEEQNLLQKLSAGNHILDWQFHLLFSNKPDARDLRPMVYPGRFVFPSWFQCDLRKDQRTPEVKQMPAKEMREVESVCEDDGILVMDLFVRNGDFTEAFCQVKSGRSNIHYLGFCESQDEIMYVEAYLKETLAQSYENGQPTPTGEKIEQDMSEDLKEKPPPHPRLNLLVLKNEELGLPVQVIREWQDHATCGPEFRKWLEGFQAKHKVIDDRAEQNETDPQGQSSDGKRANGGQVGPSPKKARTDVPALEPSRIIESSKITSALINEYSLPVGKDVAVSFHTRAENQMFLVNKGSKTWSASDPAILHFGNGSWKVLKANQDLPDGAVELKFASCDDKILLNGAVQTLGQVMADMRQKKPDAKIAYHQIQETDDIKQFSLTTTHRVVFVCKTEGSEWSSKNVASKVWKAGMDGGPLKLIWYMRWATKGLVPIKPVLHLLGHATLTAGQAADVTARHGS